MGKSRISDRWAILIVALLVVATVLPFWAASSHHTALNDDTYITLTYAKNLAGGRGFVYNHGPASQGTTTPLMTVVVAGLAALLPGAEVATLAVYLSAIFWAGSAWLVFIFRQGWGLEHWQAGTVAFSLLTWGSITFLGMEAYLFAFLLILGLSLFNLRRNFLAGFVTGLLFLTRGEGGLVLLVLLAFGPVLAMVRSRRLNRTEFSRAGYLIAGFALPVVAWFIYAYLTFGAILPDTLFAKRVQGQLPWWRTVPERLLQEWLPTWGSQFRLEALPILNLWWALVLLGVGSVAARRRIWLPLLVWIGLYVGAYSLLQVSALWWYQLPILFVAHICFALGFVTLVEFLTRSAGRRVAGSVLALASAALIAFGLARPIARSILDYEGDPRSTSYLAVAEWLREHTQPTERVAFVEVGYLGYYTDNPILDLAGLVSPRVLPYVADGDFSWGFWDAQPDYYLYLPDFDHLLGDIVADPRFEQQYEPVATLGGPQGADFTVYARSSSGLD